MRITVITLYRGKLCETYVAAVKGDVTGEQEKEIAASLELETEDGEALDTLGFQYVDLCESAADVKDFVNANADLRFYTGEKDEETGQEPE